MTQPRSNLRRRSPQALTGIANLSNDAVFTRALRQ